MKCIKNKDGEIRRVKEDEANLKISQYGWSFVPKSEWKIEVRDVNKKTVVNTDINVDIKKDINIKNKKTIRRSKFKTQ